MSGNPIVSPRASCFFETLWKFDQIAGSPITRVRALGVVCTSALRSRVASSIALELFPRYASGTNTAFARANARPGRTFGCARTIRRTAATRTPGAGPGDEHGERRRDRVRPVRLEGVRDLERRAARAPPSRRRRDSRSGGARTSRPPASSAIQTTKMVRRRCETSPASRPRDRSTISTRVAAPTP